jgi:tetratricopeptide (TPR) repeat protein
VRCKAKLAPGAHFCTQCGQPIRPREQRLPWIVAAAAIVVAIIAVLVPALGGDRSGTAAPAGDPPFAGAGAGSPPPLSGTPREQADRLFNRIMQERSAGNEEQAKFFAPMAIQAYHAASPLDADGLYHLSLILAVTGDFAAARATAQQVLDASPTHLLGLAALAEAALAAGDTAAAQTAWRTFLDNLDAEKAKQLPEYNDHAPILRQYEEDARRIVGR